MGNFNDWFAFVHAITFSNVALPTSNQGKPGTGDNNRVTVQIEICQLQVRGFLCSSMFSKVYWKVQG